MKCFRVVLGSLSLSAAVFAQLAPPRAAHANKPWMNETLTPPKRAELLVREMTLDEKISQIHMRDLKPYPREVIGIERLGLPAFKISTDQPARGRAIAKRRSQQRLCHQHWLWRPPGIRS